MSPRSAFTRFPSTVSRCPTNYLTRVGPPTDAASWPPPMTSRPSFRSGPNAISAALGDGWYRGRLGWDANDRCRYGTELGLIAQLELELADGSTQEVVTDETWWAATGEIRSADLYDGATIDLRERKHGWQDARV